MQIFNRRTSRRRRARPRSMPSAGLESLEGRQLLSTVNVAPVFSDAAVVGSIDASEAATCSSASCEAESRDEVSSAGTLSDLVNDPFLTAVLYSYPDRMASKIAASGAISINAA